MKKTIRVKFIINGISETGIYEFSSKKEAKEEFKRHNKSGTSSYFYTEIIYLDELNV
jgi:hypothetical protein